MAAETSASSRVNLAQLISVSLQVVEHCNLICKRVFASGDLQAVEKAETTGASTDEPVKDEDIEDPQTIADRRAQQVIIGTLAASFPGLHLVGEEGDLAIPPSAVLTSPSLTRISKKQEAAMDAAGVLHLDLDDVVVWVDPLDGTRAYTAGVVEAVTVLVGVSYRGRALAGVVGVPFAQPEPRVLWGVKGVGLFGASVVQPEDASRRVIATSWAHMSAKIKALIDGLKPTEMLKVGGAGHKVLLVIAGKADAYVYPSKGTKRWDTCAVEALLEAVGGKLTDVYGVPYTYDPDQPHMNSRGVCATMRNHDSYVLPKETKL